MPKIEQLIKLREKAMSLEEPTIMENNVGV
jgi:hypothetical protein